MLSITSHTIASPILATASVIAREQQRQPKRHSCRSKDSIYLLVLPIRLYEIYMPISANECSFLADSNRWGCSTKHKSCAIEGAGENRLRLIDDSVLHLGTKIEFSNSKHQINYWKCPQLICTLHDSKNAKLEMRAVSTRWLAFSVPPFTHGMAGLEYASIRIYYAPQVSCIESVKTMHSINMECTAWTRMHRSNIVYLFREMHRLVPSPIRQNSNLLNGRGVDWVRTTVYGVLDKLCYVLAHSVVIGFTQIIRIMAWMPAKQILCPNSCFANHRSAVHSADTSGGWSIANALR